MEESECLESVTTSTPNYKRPGRPLVLPKALHSPSSKGSKLAQLFQFINHKRIARKQVIQQHSQRQFLDSGPSIFSPDSPSNQPHQARYRDIQKYQSFKRRLKLEASAIDTKLKVAFYKKLASPARSNHVQTSFPDPLPQRSSKEASSFVSHRSQAVGKDSSLRLTLEQHYTQFAFRDKSKRFAVLS